MSRREHGHTLAIGILVGVLLLVGLILVLSDRTGEPGEVSDGTRTPGTAPENLVGRKGETREVQVAEQPSRTAVESPVSDRKTNLAHLIVRLVDRTRRTPVGGVPIFVQDSAERTRLAAASGESDESGEAEFFLAPRRVRVGCHRVARMVGIDLRPGETTRITLEAEVGQALIGTVTDDRKNSIGGARVWLSVPSDMRLGTWVETTRPDGSFTLPCVLKGSYLAATKPGYSESRRYPVLHLVEYRTPVELGSTAMTVRGMVTDAVGVPVSGVLCTLGMHRYISAGYLPPNNERMFGPALRRGRTGADGRFEFRDVRPGRNALRVSHPGFADYLKSGTFSASLDLVVKLESSASLSGRAIHSDGRAAAGAQIRLRSRGGAARRAIANSEGHYSISDAPLGRVDLRAILGQLECRANTSLSSGVAHDWTPILIERLTISGRLSEFEGDSGTRILVSRLDSESSPDWRYPVAIGADGKFVSSSLPAGSYQLIALSGKGELLAHVPTVTPPVAGLLLIARSASNERTLIVAGCTANPEVSLDGDFRCVYHRLNDSWQRWSASTSQVGSSTRLAPVLGRGDTTLFFRYRGAARLQLSKFKMPPDKDHRLSVSDLAARRSVKLTVRQGRGRPANGIRVVDSDGRIRHAIPIEEGTPKNVLHLPSEHCCVQITHMDFVVGQVAFPAIRASAPVEEVALSANPGVLGKVRLPNRDWNWPVEVTLKDEKGWLQAKFSIPDRERGVGYFCSGSYTAVLRSGRDTFRGTATLDRAGRLLNIALED